MQFQDFQESQNWFHVKIEWQKNPEISTLCRPKIELFEKTFLYRCVCSRNYAEWRTSWNYGPDQKISSNDFYTQIVQESVPIELKGHKHEVEALVSDGNLVVSLCLGGSLSTWDSYTGEIVTQIDRSR